MGLFDFFKFKKKEVKEDLVIEDKLEDIIIEEELPVEVNGEEEVIEEVIEESSVEEVIEDVVTEEPLVEEVKEEEVIEEPSDEKEWIPMEEVMDKLKSRLKEGKKDYDLTKFLDYDYESDGQMDGYNIHSSEYLKKKKNNLIFEFQRLVEKRIDELKDERLNCKNILIDMRSLSDQVVEKFTLRLDLCQEYIDDLHKEKELSNAAQGLVRSVLLDYECGWDKGVSDYLQDNYFLNPLKRL